MKDLQKDIKYALILVLIITHDTVTFKFFYVNNGQIDTGLLHYLEINNVDLITNCFYDYYSMICIYLFIYLSF